jgi:integrase/recombinase XerD
LFRQLGAFSETNGLVFLSDLDLEWTRKFRESWPNRNMAARKKLEALRSFLGFALEAGWIKENYATKIKLPKITDPPVLPFTPEQMKSIIGAIPKYPKVGRVRIKALVLLLRYTGLRLTDAVTLSRQKITDGKLLLRTSKTGTVIYCPLPTVLLDALTECPAGQYPFWSGTSKPKAAVGDWQRALKRLFKLAGVPDGHAHRFRHSFSVDLLTVGVPMEQVSTLLGHSSIRITERHYAGWDKARQAQLEESAKKIWQVPEISVTPTSRPKNDHQNNQ